MVSNGINHNFFCTLRLVVDGQTSYQQKLFPQSARTKCVKPMSSDVDFSIAKWNELFIFETPTKVKISHAPWLTPYIQQWLIVR